MAESRSVADEAFKSLRERAKAEFGGNTQRLMVVYGTESFLRRLAISQYAKQFVLKGGMLMAASSIRQMTKDGDFSAHGMPNDLGTVVSVISEILGLTPESDDGVIFDPGSVRAETMREDDEYQGVRCKATGILGRASIPLSLDISFGDTSDPESITISSVIDRPGVDVLAYPLSLNLAEKVVTAMQRGAANTRDRDFADLWVASRKVELDGGSLRRDIVSVAEQRGQPLIPIRQAVDGMPDRQVPYAAMLERMSYLAAPREHFSELLREVAEFLDPLIESPDANSMAWSPTETRWES